jgi:hypothetical protein
MRVITRMLTATYGESVISIPICAMCEPSGPIENGTTYSVRPRMQPSKSCASVARISAGAIQLLVGPASSLAFEQMKVRSSIRATSVGSERARKLPGRSSGFSRIKVPLRTISSHSRSYSACEPSHQWTWSGFASAAIFATHSIARGWRT